MGSLFAGTKIIMNTIHSEMYFRSLFTGVGNVLESLFGLLFD